MPSDVPEGRLRLTILGGYLGSGKTTWLRHQLHAGTFGPNVHVIVNEAAETKAAAQANASERLTPPVLLARIEADLAELRRQLR